VSTLKQNSLESLCVKYTRYSSNVVMLLIACTQEFVVSSAHISSAHITSIHIGVLEMEDAN